MSPKARFAFLSTGAGILFFAIAAALTGLAIGSLGTRHPHGPGGLMIAIIAAVYLAPVGAILGLITSLILQDRTAKKMALLLLLEYLAVIALLFGYFKFR